MMGFGSKVQYLNNNFQTLAVGYRILSKSGCRLSVCYIWEIRVVRVFNIFVYATIGHIYIYISQGNLETI